MSNLDFCYPDPKHPGFFICPYNHGDEPHIKVKPERYPNVMEQLAQVWDEGWSVGWDESTDFNRGGKLGEIPNPYRVFTQDEK